MTPPLLFPDQPKLTKSDAHRLVPAIGNKRIPQREWLATNPPLEDLKKAVLLEVLRANQKADPMATLNRGVLKMLRQRIQALEWAEIDEKIRQALTEARS